MLNYIGHTLVEGLYFSVHFSTARPLNDRDRGSATGEKHVRGGVLYIWNEKFTQTFRPVPTPPLR